MKGEWGAPTLSLLWPNATWAVEVRSREDCGRRGRGARETVTQRGLEIPSPVLGAGRGADPAQSLEQWPPVWIHLCPDPLLAWGAACALGRQWAQCPGDIWRAVAVLGPAVEKEKPGRTQRPRIEPPAACRGADTVQGPALNTLTSLQLLSSRSS